MTVPPKPRQDRTVRTVVFLAGAAALIAAVGLALSLRRPPRPPAMVEFTRERLLLEPVLRAEAEVGERPGDPQRRLRLADACLAAADPAGAALALYPLTVSSPPPEVAPRFASHCLDLGWLEEAGAALEGSPDAPAAIRFRLAEDRVERGDAAGAARLLAELSRGSLTPDERLTGAGILLRARRPEAVEWARKGVAGHPEEPAARLLLARCLYAAGQPGEVLKALPPESPAAAGDPAVEFWRARAELRSMEPEVRRRGLHRMSRVAAADGENVVAAFEVGRASLAEGKPEAAVIFLSRAAPRGYQAVLCYEMLADAYTRLDRKREAAWAGGKVATARGRLEEALARHRESLALDRTKPAAYLEVARTLAALGKPQEALRVVQQAEAAAPRNLEVAMLKASVLGRLERVTEQQRALTAASRLDERRANEPMGNLGKLLYDSQQFDEAIRVLEETVAKEDGDAFAHLYLGLAYSRRPENPQHAEKAVYHLIRAGERSPDYFFPWMNAGSVLQGAGHLPEAAACFRRAIDADSRWEGPYLSLSQVLQRQERPVERALVLKLYARARALEAQRLQLENAANERPRDAAARFALGDRLLKDGRAKEAFPELLLAASLRPEWKQAQLRLADACALLEYEDLQREAERQAGG